MNKKITRLLFGLLLFFGLLSCEPKTTPFDFLEGTWKREGKELYEFWEKSDAGLSGYSFKIVNEEKVVTEDIAIKQAGETIVLEATVPDQNEGATVTFTLNPAIKNYLSFENLQHDFPKKIQYEKIDDRRIKVNVEGANGRGFSYIQHFVKED